MPLQLDRAHDLNKFPDWRSGLEMKSQSRHLHGNCRRSAARSAVEQPESRAKQRKRVHARMSRKVFVFISKSCVDQLRRNIAQRSPDPIFLFGCESDAK